MISDVAVEAVERFAAGKSLHDKRLILETLEFLELEDFLVAPKEMVIGTADAGVREDMPTPRLQLRWEQTDYNWLCHYELVMELTEWDIRRDRRDGEEKGSRFLAVKLGVTRVNTEREDRMVIDKDDKLVVDTPYRDGAHAKWDAYALRLPLYAVWGDRISRIEPSQPPSFDAAGETT